MQRIYEDEIDLRELFEKIWAKKVFIFLCTCTIVFLATIYAFLKTPVYEVGANIEIGHIGDKLLEKNLSSLERKLNVVFKARESGGINEGIITSIAQVKGVNNFLEVKAEAISNEVALGKINDVLIYTQELFKPTIEKFLQEQDVKIAQTKEQIRAIEEIEKANLLSQINILKEQELVKIDKEIELLKTQEIPSILREIE